MSTANTDSVVIATVVSTQTVQESTGVVSAAGAFELQEANNATAAIARTKIEFFIFLFLLIVKHKYKVPFLYRGPGEIRTLVQTDIQFNSFTSLVYFFKQTKYQLVLQHR